MLQLVQPEIGHGGRFFMAVHRDNTTLVLEFIWHSFSRSPERSEESLPSKILTGTVFVNLRSSKCFQLYCSLPLTSPGRDFRNNLALLQHLRHQMLWCIGMQCLFERRIPDLPQLRHVG